MVIFSKETGKLRHGDFSKTPSRETDGEAFLTPVDGNFLERGGCTLPPLSPVPRPPSAP